MKRVGCAMDTAVSIGVHYRQGTGNIRNLAVVSRVHAYSVFPSACHCEDLTRCTSPAVA